MIALAAGVVLCLPLVFQAQVSIPSREKAAPKAPDEFPRPDLRVDRTEVLVPVAVNDTYNRPVAGLGQGKLPCLRRQGRAGHHQLFDGRRAGGRGIGVRHQRQHERHRAGRARGRDGVFQDRESRRRIRAGGVRQLAAAGCAGDARSRQRSPTSSCSRTPEARRRCWMRYSWDFTRSRNPTRSARLWW